MDKEISLKSFLSAYQKLVTANLNKLQAADFIDIMEDIKIIMPPDAQMLGYAFADFLLKNAKSMLKAITVDEHEIISLVDKFISNDNATIVLHIKEREGTENGNDDNRLSKTDSRGNKL